MSTPAESGPAAGAPKNPAAALVFDDPVSQPSADDSDVAWGEPPAHDGASDLARFLNERPPHHL